jgi:glyoxylase-like metal-dependent hydrolase (beta-lactamase superfamily II)
MRSRDLGSFRVDLVQEMSQPFPLQMAFENVTTEDLETLRPWYTDEFLGADLGSSRINLSVHSFVLRTRRRHILVDTCNGNHKSRVIPFANMLNIDYLGRLARAGLRPEDIDVVMCTHLHCDHVGWNTRWADGRWVPTFPNARYLFARPDVEYFAKHLEDEVHGPSFADSVLPVIEAGLADLVETNHVVEKELDEGVWLEGAPGHSPGCCVIHAKSAGQHAIFSGDVFHHPIQLAQPGLHFLGDMDVAAAVRTRQRIFEGYADTGVQFFPAHFTGLTAGRIESAPKGFRYRFMD